MTDALNPSYPEIDRERRSVSIPRDLMPVVLAMHGGEPWGTVADVARLQDHGLAHAENLDPLLAGLVEVMTNPTLVITVEVAGAHSPQLSTIWGTPRRAVIGRTNDRQRFQLQQIEPQLLPFHLAQATGLGPRPQPPFLGGCSVSAAALSLAEDLVAAEPDEAEHVLAAAGLGSPWSDRILIALAHRRSLWTVESVWLGTKHSRRGSRLSVLDAGSAGYWRLEGDRHQVDLTVTDFDSLLRRLAILLPKVDPG